MQSIEVGLRYFDFWLTNGKWLKVDDRELYNFARRVAESNLKFKADTIRAIETILKSYLVLAGT
ncbi:MAG: hypothetical protein Q7S84_01965 [bacterium]|nr:hypothetical protein [bacterium]